MLLTTLATVLIAQGAAASAQNVPIPGPAIVCAATGEESPATGPAVDYAGVRYIFCCGGCPDMFKKDPAKMIEADAKKKWTIGVSLFDPVSGQRIETKDAKGGYSDFGGVRYLFASTDEKAQFEKDPKTFTKAPEKEALFCAVMGHALKNYASAGGYVDVENVRYYVCCPDCLAKMKANPASFTATAKDAVKTPAPADAPKPKS